MTLIYLLLKFWSGGHFGQQEQRIVWLHNSVGRASHRLRGGHGFESRWSPVFFQASSFQLFDDHSPLKSSTVVQIWIISNILHIKSKENRIFSIPGKRFVYAVLLLKMLIMPPTRMGFEPTRAEHIGLAVQRLNHSATSSGMYFLLRINFLALNNRCSNWHEWTSPSYNASLISKL